MYSFLHGALSALCFAVCCSKLDILLEWKHVSVSKTHTNASDADGPCTATKFKMDSKFGQSFHQRFSNLLGTMA